MAYLPPNSFLSNAKFKEVPSFTFDELESVSSSSFTSLKLNKQKKIKIVVSTIIKHIMEQKVYYHFNIEYKCLYHICVNILTIVMKELRD